MSKTYRVDYAAPIDPVTNPYGNAAPIVIDDLSRTAAMVTAARMSIKHGSAYAIASQDGKDTGQRVYYSGHFSHQDYEF